jgi:tetratricopeptide (TPR) repeat protein
MSRKLAIALLALSVLSHWPIGHTDFTYDDRDFVEQNASLRSFDAALGAILLPFPPEQPERGLYRPLTSLSYALDRAVFGDDSYGYHAVNVALYALVVLLVYALARLYFCEPGGAGSCEPSGAGSWTAFAAALLFSVHPVHCDAVDSISARSELLALGWSLAGLLTFLRAARGEGPRAQRLAFASAGLYALGCASKETAVLLPVVALLHLFALEGASSSWRAFARRYLDLALPMLGVACLYLALRLQVLGGFGPSEPVLAGQSAIERIATMGSVYLEYARLLVFPHALQLDFYYQEIVGLPEAVGLRSLAGLVLAACAIGAVAASLRSRLRTGERGLADPRGLAIAGLGSALVFFAPFAHVVGIGALMAERFLFSSSLGIVFCAVGLVVALAAQSTTLARLGIGRRAARALGMGLLALLVGAGLARSHARAIEWRDGVELWRAAGRQTPDDYRVYTNIAVHWIDRGRLDKAEAALKRALELRPGQAAAELNLAVVLTERGQLEEARAIYHALLAHDPDNVVAWHNLGSVVSQQHRDSEAIPYIERALALNPNHELSRTSLAFLRDRIARAQRFLHDNRVQPESSEDPKFLDLYARACRMTGDNACADRFEALSTERSAP